MFSRFQRFYTSIKVAADVVMLTGAFALAYATRFEGPIPVLYGLPAWNETLLSLATVLLVFPFTYQQARLYVTNRARTHIGEVFEVFKATVMATLIVVALTYFTRERYSRLMLAFFAGYAFVGVSAVRLMLRTVLSEVRRRGYNLKTVLVIGTGELGQRVIETVEGHKELGFRVTGVLTLGDERPGELVRDIPVVGHVKDVDAVLDARPVDQVVIAVPLEQQVSVKPLMEQLALRTVDVKVVPDLYQYVTLYGGLEEFGGLPIISLQGDPMTGWNMVAKRVFDILFALVAIVVSSPIMLAVALAVKLTSRGPILYAQERMGMDGETFHILKFRTMRVDAEVTGAMMASKDDPRRTPIGTFLRKYSLDELPQLFNVLRGDMSMIGPRPERPEFVELFRQDLDRYADRHRVKSGITGWAQVHGLRGQTSLADRVEWDNYYIENWSLWLDLKIILLTIPELLRTGRE